jgi:hypothetical protein
MFMVMVVLMTITTVSSKSTNSRGSNLQLQVANPSPNISRGLHVR